ncbi:alpha-L-rhamnosidase C-terminal domain-containing protein [Cohnella sp. GCM10027633]|uniref:alpha-L-rhamnosidase-related protein n=1 Tax=unclassified Cohnella TaxID=2636738 RepID=UPI00363C6658
MKTVDTWSGQWIWDEGLPRTSRMGGHDLVYFRRTFEVPNSAVAVPFIVRVTADTRYRLYLNGESVSIGPAKGDALAHYYETVDLTGRLRPGTNVLAAKVLHTHSSEPFMIGSGMVSVMRSDAGGLLFEGKLADVDGTVLDDLKSDGQWRCKRDEALSFEVESWLTLFLGGVERVDGNRHPHGWAETAYDDSAWAHAVPFRQPTGMHGELSPWVLTPRSIPFLYEREQRWHRVMRAEGAFFGDAAAALAAFGGRGEMTIPPHSRGWIELDAGELTTSYVSLSLSGGSGGVAKLRYAECYETPSNKPGERLKGVRDDCSEGRVLKGDADNYRPAGLAGGESYEPFWFRTFRFLRVEVETGAAPLTIRGLAYRETGYPLEEKTSFSSSLDASLRPLWDISLRTLRRCMHETYEDCPYYEQLQYIMDTRLQMLFTYTVNGDDRLARKTLEEFHSSRLSTGMLQSRYPSVDRQVIPGFALHWIFMLHDHDRYYGDLSLVRRYAPTIDGVLAWFDERLDDCGLLGANDKRYWNYVDWVAEWPNGTPPCTEDGPNGITSLVYAVALANAADLTERIGRTDTAAEYRRRADRILEAVRESCWSEERGLFRDGPHAESYSQHMQIWAVLSGVVRGERSTALMVKMLNEPSLPKTSFSMSFYQFRALAEAGLYDRSLGLWDMWHEMVGLNLTTWMEDPVGQRSDCHAWGSVPLYEFPSEVLGVKPAAPGYSRIEVAPKPLPGQDWAEGTVVTPRGDVRVGWRIEDGAFKLRVDAPAGVPVDVTLPNGEKHGSEQGGELTLACAWTR